MQYTSLHNHTGFSMMQSVIKPEALISYATELGMHSVGVTDLNTLGGIWECYKAAKKNKIKLIVGCQFSFVDNLDPFIEFNNSRSKKPDLPIKNLVLIARNATGYSNILKLNLKAFDCRFNKTPLIDWKLLEEYSCGNICLTGDATGIIGRSICNRDYEKANNDMLKLKGIFSEGLAIELQPNNLRYNSCDQTLVNRKLAELSTKLNIKPIAASNARYLKKEQDIILDVVMAISSGRSLKNRSRPRFECPQLYLHTKEDVISFFERNYSRAFGELLCDNANYFASECEKPEWVKPEVLTGDKVQLPTFNVKEESCYNELIEWTKIFPDNLKDLSEDKKYMRYCCEKNWKKLIPADKEKEYRERYEKEIEVYEHKNFSSYMLITADFLRWARENNIGTGPGRGCLSGDTLVLTKNGFKKLSKIKINEKVYTHTGTLKNVLNTFKFDVKNEDLIKLNTENSVGDIILTSDHKIYGCKRRTEKVKCKVGYANKLKFDDPYWIKACDIEHGDFIYTKFPENKKEDYNVIFDLSNFTNAENVINDKIIIRNKKVHRFSIREISRKTKLNFEQVRRIKNGRLINKNHVKIISNYLEKNNCSFDNWLKMQKWEISYVNRYIKLDDDFLYVLGYWVGDGSLRHKQKHGINYSFNINEKEKINTIKSFYKKTGFNTYCKQQRNSFSIDIGTTILSDFFKTMFVDYKNSSKTKHLPVFFRKLSNRQLKILIKGICDSDGHIIFQKRDSIRTTSKRLVLELKECFDYIGIQSGIDFNKKNNMGGRNNAKSYLIRFSGIRTEPQTRRVYKNGYYSLIKKPQTYKTDDVYDITVEEDNSYLTSSGVVHNSVGGSLVGYLLEIHKADPIKYNLIFERFLNEEKISLTDVDIDNDIDSDGREKVLQYVNNKYGKTYVARVSNFITFTPKVAITDVMTVLEIGGSRKDAFRIAKNMTETISAAKTIKEAIKESKLFAEFIKENPKVKEYAEQITGLIRSFATHAAGVVIGKYDFFGLVPLRLDDENALCLEWEKYKTEENGLVKIDFLGLDTLNIIKTTENIIKELGKDPPKFIDYDEPHDEIYDMITNGKTSCVFQLGASGGTIGLCNMTQPKTIEDLAVINALTRPGVPKEIKLSYIKRKFGEEKIEIPHENLRRAVQNTMGYCIFDESFLWLAHDLCGWNLDKASKMKQISKLKAKSKHLLNELHDGFISSAVEYSNVHQDFAENIWNEWIIPLSGYAFNKSHAILYSMTSFNTAYLRYHYFNEFMTANLIAQTKSNTPKSKENIPKIKHELRKNKVKIVPPDINKSYSTYRLVDQNTLITGFSALHGTKEPAAINILENRPFTSFEDFLVRTDSSKVRAPTIQGLAACGALDVFGLPRKTMALYCSDIRKKYKDWIKRNPGIPFEYKLTDNNGEKEEWSMGELRALENHFIGEGLSGTKKDSFKELFSGSENITKIKDVAKLKERERVVLEAEVKDLFLFKVKKEKSKIFGKECCRMLLEDEDDDQISIVFFPEALDNLKYIFMNYCEDLKFDKGFGIRVSGQVNMYNNEVSIIASDIYGIFSPLTMPTKMEQRKIVVLNKKKINEISAEDIEKDLLSIISDNSQQLFNDI